MSPTFTQTCVDLNREQDFSNVLEMEIQNLKSQVRLMQSALQSMVKLAGMTMKKTQGERLAAIQKIGLQALWAKATLELDPSPNRLQTERTLEEVIALCGDGCDDSDLIETEEVPTRPL